MRVNLTLRLVFFIAVLMVAVTGLLAYFSWNRGFKNLEERFGLVLKHIAINTAIQIDGHEHSRILRTSDKESDAFQRIHEILRKAMVANYLTPETFYTFQIRSDQTIQFAVMLHQRKFIGDSYHPPAINRPYFAQVLNGESVFTHIYSDSHGTWISGLAPIKTQGRVTGIVEADFRVEKFVSELRLQTLEIVQYSILILIIAIVLAIWLTRRITKPIKALSQTAVAVAEGNPGNLVAVKRRDEIGDLQQSFNEMLKSINERYRMLKYLSPHTKRMIEQEIHDPHSADGNLRNVVLFFSDIRGFTKYSADREPKEVIENLNKILGKQAELIESFGGDIDKFVGDEIVAVFEGEKAERLAIHAAIEIQRMARNNESNPDYEPSLHIGIGIASGEIVMGNIGSAGRKDFTVIGSNVNLASRICSAAGAGEILLSSHVYYRLTENSEFLAQQKIQVVKKGNLKAKGFADTIPVYSCIL